MTEGALKTEAGRICTVADPATATNTAAVLWATRLRSASVTPRGKLHDAYNAYDKTTWVKAPFNVRVADQALEGAALEDVLAGSGYRDATHRRAWLNLLGWFPGVCGDRPAGDTRPWRAACRADVAALATFALFGEPNEAEYKRDKVLYPAGAPTAAWW